MVERPPPLEIGNSLRKPGHKPGIESYEKIKKQKSAMNFLELFHKKPRQPKLAQTTTLKGIMLSRTLKPEPTVKQRE